MSITFQAIGNRQTFFSAPTNTTAVAIYSVPDGVFSTTVVGLTIAATAGGAAASVWINNGATDYPLLDAKSISANSSEVWEFGNPVLYAGWSIKVKDGTGSKLTFTLTIAEEYRL